VTLWHAWDTRHPDSRRRMGWAGRPVKWRSIIVPVVPFERPTVIDDQVESRYIDARKHGGPSAASSHWPGAAVAGCEMYDLLPRPRVLKLPAFWPIRFASVWESRPHDPGVVEGHAAKLFCPRRSAIRHSRNALSATMVFTVRRVVWCPRSPSRSRSTTLIPSLREYAARD